MHYFCSVSLIFSCFIKKFQLTSRKSVCEGTQMGQPRLFDNRLNILTYIALPLCLGLAIVVSDWRYVIGLAAILLFFYPGPHVQC